MFFRKKKKEGQEMAEKKELTPEEANQYMEEVMGFVPRMFRVINQMNPEAGKTFADFYNSLWKDGAISKKMKELIFTAIGVATMSPRCLIHVVPAMKAGATVEEVFEAASIGVIAAGFVANGKGIPYAFEYAVKAVEIAQKFQAGEDWEYLPEPKFDHGIH